jgi:predicted metal-dependent peptidase
VEFTYYARAISSLTFYESEDVDTLAVDQHLRCYVNAEYFLSLTLKEQVGVLVHETLHPVMNHAARCEWIFADAGYWQGPRGGGRLARWTW